MDYMLKIIEQNFVAIVLFLIGIIASIVITRYYYKIKILYIQSESNLIFNRTENIPNDLVIEYNGEPIKQLVKTTIYIWNGGKETILNSDIAMKDKLRFEITDNLYEMNFIKHSREACDINLKISNTRNIIDLSFDFIDKNDGFSFSILHDSIIQPNFEGSIKGAEIKHIKETNNYYKLPATAKIMDIIISVLFPLLSVFFLYSTIVSVSLVGKFLLGFLFLFSLIIYIYIFIKPSIIPIPPKTIRDLKDKFE